LTSDIAIVGGGITGLSVAFDLAEREVGSIIVYEREGIGGRGLGSTASPRFAGTGSLGTTWVSANATSVMPRLRIRERPRGGGGSGRTAEPARVDGSREGLDRSDAGCRSRRRPGF
jgi:glycine/D-amino acid oxidase-like deaminating enzyme